MYRIPELQAPLLLLLRDEKDVTHFSFDAKSIKEYENSSKL